MAKKCYLDFLHFQIWATRTDIYRLQFILLNKKHLLRSRSSSGGDGSDVISEVRMPTNDEVRKNYIDKRFWIFHNFSRTENNVVNTPDHRIDDIDDIVPNNHDDPSSDSISSFSTFSARLSISTPSILPSPPLLPPLQYFLLGLGRECRSLF